MVEPASHPPVRQIHIGQPATDRLHQLGLTSELLSRAAARGDEARQECTVFHPAQSKGHRMWSDTIAALREACMVLGDGWKIDRTSNFETVAHVERGLAIAVVGGDEFTGWRGDKQPRVRRKRGPVTMQRVLDNYLGMEPLFPIKTSLTNQPETWQTWFFLIRATDDALWLELSRPIGHDRAGYISDWSERIIMPPLPVSGGVTPIADDDEDDGPFTISRK